MRGTKSPIKSFVENSEELGNYASVRRWLSTVRQDGIGSDKTEVVYLLYLNRYCGFWNKSPDQLIEERKRELKSEDEDEQCRAEEQLREFGNYLEQKLGLRGASMQTYHGGIRSFYAANYVELKLKTPPRASEQRLPARKEDIIQVLKYANLRDRAIVLGLKDSGISAEDFVELAYSAIQYEFEKNMVPICISLIREKRQIRYQTFLGVEAVKALHDYLDERKRRGEAITSSSPLFIGNYRNGKQLTTRGLASILRRLSEQAGTIITSHGLRKFFETSVALGLPRGSPAFLPQYWMGHSLGVEGHYFIPPVEEQREAYRQAYEKLALFEVPQGLSDKQTKLEIVKKVCEALGLGELTSDLRIHASIATIDDEIAFYEQLINRRKAGGGLGVANMQEEPGPTYESTVIKEKDLPAYLKKGWEFVSTLNREKVVIKRKTARSLKSSLTGTIP